MLREIQRFKHQAYFVGGCIRDSLLHRPVKDIDIATSATPEEMKVVFPHIIPVGMEHGTVIVRYKHKSYEVTTFRLETVYTDHRRPDEVIFINDINKDLARRDFTINAMAMDVDNHLIDPFGGRKDLEANIIRTVGNAKARFQEDALRMIRALRFASQLGFQIEAETLKQMEALRHLIQKVSVERITMECTKLFQGKDIALALKYLRNTGMHRELPVWKGYPDLIDKFPNHMTPFVSFAEVVALFAYLEPEVPIRNWVKAWKCSNKELQEASQLFEGLYIFKENGVNSRLLYSLQEANLGAFVHLVGLLFPESSQKVKELLRQKRALPIQSKSDIALNGHELADMYPNRRKGPWLGNVMNRLEKAILSGEVMNSKYDLKEWILCHPPDID